MVIKNLTTGKKFEVLKDNFDKMAPKYKKNFEIVEAEDKKQPEEIVVTNTHTNTAPPKTGDKKSTTKKK